LRPTFPYVIIALGAMSHASPVTKDAEPVPIRLRAVYQTAGALLRELSRALNKGGTIIRADSGLPVGSRLGLVMQATGVRPIEVVGTVTASRPRGAAFELKLRYDFDFLRFRSRLAEAVAAFKRENPTRRPRLEARIPVALSVDARRVATTGAVTVQNFSRAGCRLEFRGGRLPAIRPRSRLEMSIAAGGRQPLRVSLDVRWVGVVRTADSGRYMIVGGRFLGLTRVAKAKIGAILEFKDYRPRIRVRRILLPPRGAPAG
jgi:hypothetical protein